MEALPRPWFTKGVAFVGAGAIALAPLTPIVPTSAPAAAVSSAVAAVSRDFQLTALDIPYLLTLPIIRQYIVNEVQNIAVFFGGFAKSGVGLAQSLLAIPGVTVQAIQQVLALDFVGAFNTVATAIRDSVVAVGQPLLDSIVWRAQRADLVQAALQAATPQAIIDIANGFLTAGNGVATSLIEGTQNLIAAVLTLNLSNIINAALQGTQNFIVALGAGAGAIVDGLESAQLGISTALATTPPPPPTFADVTAASEVTALATPSVDTTTVTLSRAAKTAAIDPVTTVEPTTDDPAPVVSASVVDTVQDLTPPSTAPATPPSTPEPKTPVDATPKVDAPKTPAVDATPVTDASTDPAPTGSPKKPHDTSTDKDDLSQPKKPAGADKGGADAKDAGVKKDAGADKDSGSDAKPAKGGDGAE